MVRRRLLPLALALVAGVTVLVVVLAPGRRVAGTPTPYCTSIQVLFDTDEDMRHAAGELRADSRVREVRDERTKAQNHERLTATLRATGRDDLADAVRVNTTPASLRVVESFGVDPQAFADELRREHRVNHVNACGRPEVWEGWDVTDPARPPGSTSPVQPSWVGP
jgi:hypothetical protein